MREKLHLHFMLVNNCISNNEIVFTLSCRCNGSGEKWVDIHPIFVQFFYNVSKMNQNDKLFYFRNKHAAPLLTINTPIKYTFLKCFVFVKEFINLFCSNAFLHYKNLLTICYQTGKIWCDFLSKLLQKILTSNQQRKIVCALFQKSTLLLKMMKISYRIKGS